MFSLLKNTPFYNKKTSILEILTIKRMWRLKIKQNAITEWLQLDSRCARRVILEIVQYLEEKVMFLTGMIGGPGVVVEFDESKFGKVKYHRGHRVEGVWVFGMVERSPQKKLVMVIVDDRKRQTLEEILKQYVHLNLLFTLIALNHTINCQIIFTGTKLLITAKNL